MRRCIVCGAKLFDEPVLSIDNMPSGAQNIPDEKELKNDIGIKVNLCECSGCGLIQLDNGPVKYYKDVIRAGGYSTTMENLRKAQYSEWIKLCNLEGKKILEAGCGRGEFLKTLTAFWVEAYGIENKKELVEQAKQEGLCVTEEFAGDENMSFINGPFDGFTSFNFLEHQPDPCTYLRAVYNNLNDDGSGLITVPSFEYILERDSFYEIIPDHIAYYTKESLRTLLEMTGFAVIKIDRVNNDTLSAIVRKRKRVDVKTLIQKKDDIAAEVVDILNFYNKNNKKIAIWGASHQGFTLCATTNLGEKIEYIIDSAPFKQNKFAPVSHIRIVSPDYAVNNPTDAIIIVAPGYTDEIAGIIKSRFESKTNIYTLKTNHLEKIV